MLQTTIVMVIVIVAVAITIVTNEKTHTTGPGVIEGRAAARVLGISESGRILGGLAAPVTLQYFADLGSPRCREFTLSVLPEIIRRWVRKGTLRIEYHALRIATGDPQAFDNQQVAALAAGPQNKLWYFIAIFSNEPEPRRDATASFGEEIAKQIPGLDVEQWKSAREDPALERQIAADALTAKGAGINMVPAFLIGKTGGAMKRLHYDSLTDPASFNKAIARLTTQQAWRD
jgi:protein-disulfide isomerase